MSTEENHKPVRIYLDTSDYINLFSAKPDSVHFEIKTQLTDWVNFGSVEIGYSFWIVTEFIKDNGVRYKEDSKAKGEFLNSLTKGKSFPHPLDFKLGKTFPNNGIWMPTGIFGEITQQYFFQSMAQMVMKEKRLNRDIRRRLSTKKGVLEILRHSIRNKSIKKEDFYPFPVSEQFVQERHFEKFVLGKISKQQFQIEFLKWCSKPEAYYELWFENLNLTDPIDGVVDKFFNKFSKAAENLANAVYELQIAQKRADVTRRHYEKLIKESDLPKKLLSKFPKTPESHKPISLNANGIAEPLLKLLPSNQVEYFDEYFESVMNGRKPCRSDIVDLMHFQYIFSCDLFRCDKKNAALYRNSTKLPKEKIVGRLIDLPSRIRALLKEQKQETIR